jgi:hypothetical protein
LCKIQKKRVIALLLLLLVGITIIIVSFYYNKQVTQFGLFGEGRNLPPCWWKVCAGQKYDSDYLLSLAKSDANTSYIVENPRMPSIELTLYDPDQEHSIHALLHLYDNLAIELIPRYRLTIGQIISKFGPPEYIGIEPFGSSAGCSLNLYYQKYGLLITTLCAEIGGNVSVVDTITIDYIQISYNDTEILSNRPYTWTKWHGLGVYDVP